MAPKPMPNGTAEAPIEVVSSFAPVVGINFGNSFASIAVLTKVFGPCILLWQEIDLWMNDRKD